MAFAAAGNDIGLSASWKAGVSWLHTEAEDRRYEEADATLAGVYNPTAFSGDSGLWNGYAVWKWAPNGNSRERNLKLQAEYFTRTEDGALEQENATHGVGTAAYRSAQSGWYAQGVYQFVPNWRIGLRYDRLDSGSPRLGFREGKLGAGDFPTLESYDPQRTSVMLDYSPSEFSRLRLQYARDENAPGVDDDQIYLQYLMSLGAHGAHQF
jgi:outer membrane receptor protein involved in Fe transport